MTNQLTSNLNDELQRLVDVVASAPSIDGERLPILIQLRTLQQRHSATALIKECPYCKRPADPEGSIYHVGGCAGLETVTMNRLQYDALIKAPGNETFERQPDSVPPELCTNPFCIGGITDDGLCERCGGTGNLPPAQKASEGQS